MAEHAGRGVPAGRLRLGSAVAPLAVAWAIGIARFPLDDNSFLTHLATGRLILDEGRVPSVDPYSFTAAGEPWTVQSWLASVAYAGAERLGGELGLRLLVLALFLSATVALVALSSAATSLLARIVIVFVPLAMAADLWSARPYMVGVIGLGVVWLAVEGRAPPWTLLPLLWIWANTHGSFPLAGVLVVTLVVGLHLDGQPVDRAIRVLAWVAGGTALAVLNPRGPELLLFPLRAVTRREQLERVVEWRAPDFVDLTDRLFLLVVLAAVVGLVRRPAWRLAVPTLVFVAMALVARRNVVMALPVLVPVLSATLGDLGSLRVDDRPSIARPLGAVSAAALVLAGLAFVLTPSTTLAVYPERAMALLGPDREATVVTQDFTGNLLTVLDGTEARVFIDDRVDMYPPEVIEDYQVLLDGQPGWSGILDGYGAELVVWGTDQPLAALLAASDGWRPILVDERWALFERRP